jgi:hypothetical protein
MALFGLYQAIFMANAGGAWDNAKKVVETELRAKNTDLHAATIVGDTVGDPFKDTSSVALNPVIKFTTLFGVLAVGLALQLTARGYNEVKYVIAGVSMVISMTFAWRSFYGMRIGDGSMGKPAGKPIEKHAVKAEKHVDEKVEKAESKQAEKIEKVKEEKLEKAVEKAEKAEKESEKESKKADAADEKD